MLHLNGEQTLRNLEQFALSLVQADVFSNGACDRRLYSQKNVWIVPNSDLFSRIQSEFKYHLDSLEK